MLFSISLYCIRILFTVAEWTPGAHEVLREGFLNEGKHTSYPAFPTHPPRKGAGIHSFPPSLEPTLRPFANACSSLGKGGAVLPPSVASADPAGGRLGGRAGDRGRPCGHHLALHSRLGGARANAIRCDQRIGSHCLLLSASMPDGAPAFSPKSFGFRVSGVGWPHLSSLPTVISNIKWEL